MDFYAAKQESLLCIKITEPENTREMSNETMNDLEVLSEEQVSAFTFNFQSLKLKILDQLLLPDTIKYVDVPDCDSGYNVIKSMMVRGAPCIAAVGCLSILAELGKKRPHDLSAKELLSWLSDRSNKLISARPTAVNLRNAIGRLLEHARNLAEEPSVTANQVIEGIRDLCQDAVRAGLSQNKIMSGYGADEVSRAACEVEAISVLTHCNTGALATVGYGTALGVIRTLHNRGVLKQAYCTETRPYNQGSRLTAWELVREGIPGTLITDSMVAYLMDTRRIDAVLVGADCVASNGDTANKVGTLQLAVLAKHFKIPFYVVAPTQSLDLTISNQKGIKIEQRPPAEMKQIGPVKLAPDAIDVWNPCFDVTPGELITKIVTELGVCKPENTKTFVESADVSSEFSLGLF